MSDRDRERRSLSKGEWAAVALAVVVVAAAAWVWLRRPGGPVPAPASAAPTAATSEAAAPAEEGPVAPVPDAKARPQLESLSSDPNYRRWLAMTEDVIARWAVVTDNLAEGVSPRKALEVVGPKTPFRVLERGGKTVISPDAYARYDEFATAVGSVDPQAFATVYRAFRPAIQAAYRALGYPKGSLDAVTARALHRLEGAPVVDGEVELTPDRGFYRFADPKLEGLREVEKHLLRMGPRNTRTIQAKAKEIGQALNFPAEAASAQ
ncbi:MAG TPA: DUF3014 domain-containing protein [Anaeromyxobacter sp.]|nr:DUF3014 domain-containing protein [Anaeromyxobacter sp.]